MFGRFFFIYTQHTCTTRHRDAYEKIAYICVCLHETLNAIQRMPPNDVYLYSQSFCMCGRNSVRFILFLFSSDTDSFTLYDECAYYASNLLFEIFSREKKKNNVLAKL